MVAFERSVFNQSAEIPKEMDHESAETAAKAKWQQAALRIIGTLGIIAGASGSEGCTVVVSGIPNMPAVTGNAVRVYADQQGVHAALEQGGAGVKSEHVGQDERHYENQKETFDYSVSMVNDAANPEYKQVFVIVNPKFAGEGSQKHALAKDLQILSVDSQDKVQRVWGATDSKGMENSATGQKIGNLGWIMHVKNTDQPFHLYIGNEKGFAGQNEFPGREDGEAWTKRQLFGGALRPVTYQSGGELFANGPAETWATSPGLQFQAGKLSHLLAEKADWDNCVDIEVDPSKNEISNEAVHAMLNAEEPMTAATWQQGKEKHLHDIVMRDSQGEMEDGAMVYVYRDAQGKEVVAEGTVDATGHIALTTSLPGAGKYYISTTFGNQETRVMYDLES